jgi:hypothetical protein
MKRILLVLALVVAFATPARANDANCAAFAQAIEQTASAHQSGTPLSKVLELAAKHKPVLRSFILKIYEGPRYSTPEMQLREIAEWRDAAMLWCVRGT